MTKKLVGCMNVPSKMKSGAGCSHYKDEACECICHSHSKTYPMGKLEAIRHFFDNDVYVNEWTGAGMWEAVRKVISNDEIITKNGLTDY